MPPINQQGSRAGLVTALVVFVILFVVASVMAFQSYGKYKDANQSFEDLKKKYADYIVLPGPTATGPLADLMSNKLEGETAMDSALRQINTLQKALVGSAAVKPADAAKHAADALIAAQATLTKAGISSPKMPTIGLEEAVKSLTTAVVDKNASVLKLTGDLSTTTAQLNTAKNDITKQAAQHDAEMKKLQADDAAALATAEQAATKNDAAMAAMKQDEDAAAKKCSDDAQQAATDLNNSNQQIAKLTKDNEALRTRLAGRRADVVNPIVQQADGKIVRVPNNEVCYINLGQGDQVNPGLTFEVYDKSEGVPPIPPNAIGDEQLPVGKASIEITHVGTTSSECRIVKLAPGAVIQEGDVIANLVYDPHIKYNFFVYGKFDLANNGRPNDADADVIKRLVTQWGAKLTDQINVDTDFVVMGSEPVLPEFSKDELTAENQKKLDDAQKALDEYRDKKTEAEELHIPILNQNRFLYYVGFYDQAKR